MRKRNKKIAFVTPIYTPANLYGSDRAVKILSESLASDGYDVSIITSNAYIPKFWYDPFFSPRIQQSYALINGVKVYRLSCNHIKTIFYFIISRFIKFLPKKFLDYAVIRGSGPHLSGLYKFCLNKKFDLIHCSPFPLNINKQVVDVARLLVPKPNTIITPFFHVLVENYHNKQLDALMKDTGKIHVVSWQEKNEIENEFLHARNKCIMIPLYLPKGKLQEKRLLLEEINMYKANKSLSDRFVVLFAGLKGKMKGALDVLDAVKQLHKTDKRFVLIAIGHDTDEWKKAIVGVSSDILINYGYVEERFKEVLFASADVFCMPSKSESFGYVYLEAWHKSTPVIAADIPVVKELVGEAGILVPFGNVSAIIDAIKSISTVKGKGLRIGDAGKRRLQEYYSEEVVYPMYKKLLSL